MPKNHTNADQNDSEVIIPEVIHTHNRNHTHTHYHGYVSYGAKNRNKRIALLLAIFFGYFGFHRFYTGHVILGIFYFFTGGFFCIGWFLDILWIVFDVYKDANGLLLD